MTPAFARLVGDAWALARRERALILAVAGVSLFLPALAVQLLVAPPPAFPDAHGNAALQVWADAFGDWARANGGWHLLARAAALIGIGAITALFLAVERPDVAGAIRLALALLLRLALAAILTAIPVGVGLWLLFLPGLYLQARLIAAVPVLVAERPIGAAAALSRSFRLTRRSQWGLFGGVALVFALQLLALNPLVAADLWLRAPGHGNPLVTAMVGALLAAVVTAYQLALAMLGIVAYRAGAESRGI